MPKRERGPLVYFHLWCATSPCCSPHWWLPAPYLTAQITVSFPASASSKPLDGRVLLLLSTDPAKEPRMQIDDSPRSQIVFGTTVDGLAPDQAVTISNEAAGYPIRSLDQVPAGDYYVQAVLNVYQTFHRADGKTVKLAPDRGEGQHWNLAPGNLYSKPVKVHIDGHTSLPFGSRKPSRLSPRSRTPSTFATSASRASC